MLEIFKKLTGGPKAATSADLRATLAELDEVALDAAVEAAKADVSEAILSGAEKAVEKAEVVLEVAERNRDRATIARAELHKRLSAAEAAEADAALNAEREAVEADAKAVASALRREWPALQSKMVGLLERLSAAEEAVRAVNGKLHAAGRTDVVADTEWRARPRPVFAYEGTVSILSNVALPEIAEWGVAAYGPPLSGSAAFYHQPHHAPDVNSDWPEPRVIAGAQTVFPTSY